VTTYTGSCHCGGIGVSFETAMVPSEMEVRLCQCQFCCSHGAKAVSDPNGNIAFTEIRPGALHRYMFGLRTAEFLICRECGVYVGAVMSEGDQAYGIVNIRALSDEALFSHPPVPADYDDEEESDRRKRRRARWTPVRAAIA